MGPFQALDARLYLDVNGQAHPRLLDEACKVVTYVTTGGWIWILATLLAYRLGVPRSGPALLRHHSVSDCFPPGSRSTPSKRTFAAGGLHRRRARARGRQGARQLVIPQRPHLRGLRRGVDPESLLAAARPLFFGVASMLGYSRVFVGAHYPGMWPPARRWA